MVYAWQLPGWPRFEVDTSTVISTVRRYQALCIDASKEYGLLEKCVQRDTLLEWLVSEAISTSAIEGENLNRKDVRSSIMNHLGMHDPPLRVGDPRAEGVAALVLDVRENAGESLTAEMLCRWQSMVIQPRPYLDKPLVIGAFRHSSQPMQIVSGPTGYEKVHYEAPAGAEVPGEINAFLKWYNKTTPSVNSDPGIPGLVRAAVAHAWLELVHPFDDGNGRVGRAVTDHALYQDMRSVPLFSLSATIEKNRNIYYEKLATVNRSLDFTEWVVWFAETACEAQIEAQNALAFALEKTRFWDEFGETAFNSRQTKAINRMFKARPVGFEGGMTARKYTSLTGASRATATRDLGDLVGKGALQVEGRGRSVSYVLMLSGREPGFLERILSSKPI
jgi:Fic family protein